MVQLCLLVQHLDSCRDIVETLKATDCQCCCNFSSRSYVPPFTNFRSMLGPSLYRGVAAVLRRMLRRRQRTLLLGCGQSALGGTFWLSPRQGPRQVCFSLLGMCALFVLFKGWLWVGAWKVLGVSVPLPPCSRARRSPSTLLGGRGLVVAAHRVVMVALRTRL